MRKELKNINGKRLRFNAKIEKFGSKRAFRGPDIKTILVTEVIDTNTQQQVTDHLWFTCGKNWGGLEQNDIIEFYARVVQYEKGYKGYKEDVYKDIERDYKLSRPTKIKKIS